MGKFKQGLVQRFSGDCGWGGMGMVKHMTLHHHALPLPTFTYQTLKVNKN